MKTLGKYIIEKLHIDKNSKSKIILLYRSSNLDIRLVKKRIHNRCELEDFEISKKEETGALCTYEVLLNNLDDVLSVCVLIFDNLLPSEDLLGASDNFDKYIKKSIINYDKEWKSVIHDYFSDDDIKNRIIKYIRKNY